MFFMSPPILGEAAEPAHRGKDGVGSRKPLARIFHTECEISGLRPRRVADAIRDKKFPLVFVATKPPSRTKRGQCDSHDPLVKFQNQRGPDEPTW